MSDTIYTLWYILKLILYVVFWQICFCWKSSNKKMLRNGNRSWCHELAPSECNLWSCCREVKNDLTHLTYFKSAINHWFLFSFCLTNSTFIGKLEIYASPIHAIKQTFIPLINPVYGNLQLTNESVKMICHDFVL